ncbi:hypothetical protein BLOT_013796 [Blomia tropicalis]|nr:hypothetical protein BLOT_013796 [Blomia tropicalis]
MIASTSQRTEQANNNLLHHIELCPCQEMDEIGCEQKTKREHCKSKHLEYSNIYRVVHVLITND